MSELLQAEGELEFDEATERMISDLWEIVKDHGDDCGCADCRELEILAFK